jgi:hypothetical protein
VFQDFEIEFYADFWFFHVWNAEVNAGSNWGAEGKHKFREDRAESVLRDEWMEFSFLLIVRFRLVFLFELFECFLGE